MMTGKMAVKNEQSTAGIKPPSRIDNWKMFDRISKRYDLLNHLLSFRQDIRWRGRVSGLLPRRKGLELLDLATGTGDMLIELAGNKNVVSSVGLDMAGKMLEISRRKLTSLELNDRASLIRSDAESIPCADASFDLVSIAFGIRNMVDLSLSFSEIYRVLRPNGRALILEFSLPKNRLIRSLYLVYFTHILPRLGAAISGDRYAYNYLMKTVATFPYGQEFCALMERAGFVNVKATTLSFGIATIYQGDRIPTDNQAESTARPGTD